MKRLAPFFLLIFLVGCATLPQTDRERLAAAEIAFTTIVVELSAMDGMRERQDVKAAVHEGDALLDEAYHLLRFDRDGTVTALDALDIVLRTLRRYVGEST